MALCVQCLVGSLPAVQAPKAARSGRVPSSRLCSNAGWRRPGLRLQTASLTHHSFRVPVSIKTRSSHHRMNIKAATVEEIEAEKKLVEEDAMERMEKTLETVRCNFNTVRTGRASPALLDRVEVEYYGSLVALKSIAQVSTPDGSTILIQPFDKSSLSAIDKAIKTSDVGLPPSSDGIVIRLSIPQLTTERRKDLLKLVAKLAEEGKIALRNVRRDAIKSYEKLVKEKKISEDNMKDLSVEMQKLTDEYVKKVDDIFKQKEKELIAI